MVTQVDCSIAILAGGQSRRLGQDKALISVHGDGRPLIAHMIERLQPLSDDLFIVGPERPGYRDLNAPLALDDFPGEGPLGGIATALRHARHPQTFIVACDLPFVSVPLIRLMMERGRLRDAIIPCMPVQSRQGASLTRQSTHAIYARTTLVGIELALAQGVRQVSLALESLDALELPVDQLLRFDPGLRSFFNVNTPDDCAQATDWLQSPLQAPVSKIDTIY